jgi:hypothetical protein
VNHSLVALFGQAGHPSGQILAAGVGLVSQADRQPSVTCLLLSGGICGASTTLLVSPRTKGLDLIGLEEPEKYLPMDVRERATRD